MSLNAKQKEAVEYIQGPLLVLAGPGTGKTHLLSNRVEYILKGTDTNPENILCLTFTDSGASNMRTRLLSSVGKAASRLEIHTYHAFGSYLLMAYKDYAEKFNRIMDSPIDKVMQFKIVKEIQESLNANDILRTTATGNIIDTIQSAKSARLTGNDLIKIADENIRLSGCLSGEADPILKCLVPRMKFDDALEVVYKPLLAVFAKYTSKNNIVGSIEPISNAYYMDLKKLILQESDKEKPSVSSFTKWKNSNFELNDDGIYRLKTRVANLKLKSLGNIMNLYDERLKQDGLFDFADMIEQAIAVLKDDKGFRLTMSERFQYILLDEFQDTNPSQFELIRLLTDYDEPNVMAVGDDDQAIYEFQGADASNLLTFQQHYGAKVINLEENYRSFQEILDLSRKVADQIDGSFVKNPAIKQKATISKNLGAVKQKGAVIARHEFLTAEGEYEFVAQEIERLIESGISQNDIAIIAPQHKYILPILPFLKSKTKINISYEKRDNLLDDPRLGEILTLSRFIDNLARGRNVSSMLLEVLSFPFWGISPGQAYGIINNAREDKKSPMDYLIRAESPRLRDIGEFLAKCAMLSFDSPLELMLDYLVGTVPVKLPSEFTDSKDLNNAMICRDSDDSLLSREGALKRSSHEFRSPFIEYYDTEQGEYETFELYENLAVLKEAILAHSNNRKLRISDLVQLVDDYEAAGEALINTSPYRDGLEAVQILTAHKSKGLEFEYVFLIAVDSLNWGKAKGNNTTFSLPKNVIQIRHTGITDDERLRLLFVAMTRAKSHLIMTNSLKNFSGKCPARLEYLEEYEDASHDVISPFIGKVVLHYDNMEDLRKNVDLRKTWRTAYTKLSPELRPILVKRMQDKYRLSATDLTSFIDIVYGGPLKFYVNRILGAPQEPATGSMIFGTLMHQVFERVTVSSANKETFSDDDAILMYRKLVDDTDVDDKDKKYMLERGEASLKISLETFRDILRDPESKAEVSLFSEHPEIDGVPVVGVIDHMKIDRKAKTIEIYDFKTGKYYEKKWGSLDTLYKYMLQLGFYKLMIESVPTFRGYKVNYGHILFVTPDDDGKVHDKLLRFDDSEQFDEKLTRRLISAVYKQATTLEFLDDHDLMIDADKSKGLKDIKEFIELLLEKSTKR